jgi:hypothetical protein
MLSNPLLAEVDIKLLKQKYPQCENSNYRHACFDDAKERNFRYIGYFMNNSLWDGQHFQNDILKFEFINGKIIAKSFCKDKEDGWTICPSGNRYKPIENGFFDKNNKRQGKFIVEFSSGNKFNGEFKNGNIHGQGTFTFVNGSKYIGFFKDNKFHGQGTYIFANGRKNVGEWQNGTLNGFATQYNAEGIIRQEGIFKDGKFLYARKKSKPPVSNSKLDKYKSFCEEIGFVQGTEKFGDCVLEAMKKG